VGEGRCHRSRWALPAASAALGLAAAGCACARAEPMPSPFIGAAGAGGAIDAPPLTGGGDGANEPPGVVTHAGPLSSGETWARAWGGDGWCESQAVAFAPDGSLYVTGWFSKTTDFDPDEPSLEVRAPENTAAFLSHFDAEGRLLGTLTWVSHDQVLWDRWGNEGWTIAFDADGNLYLGGQYSGTLDFDPGPGVVEHASAGGFDAFVVKLSPAGEYLWHLVWDTTEAGRVGRLAVDGGSVFLGGQFAATADFDPGPGQVLRTARPPDVEGYQHEPDCAVVAISAAAGFQWARTWGNQFNDWECAVAVGSSILFTGNTSTPVPLDEAAGVGQVGPGSWLVSLDPSGMSHWASTFEGGVSKVAALPEGGSVVCGEFRGTADFGTLEQPGVRDAGDRGDAFVLSFDEVGVPRWVRTWGGEGHAWAIALDATATEILAAGRYEGTVDFDGQTVTAEQDRAFVRGYSLDGEPLFTHLVEGGGSFAGGVAVQDGVAAAVGAFFDEADFDFGQGPDVWSSPGLYACWLVRFPVANE